MLEFYGFYNGRFLLGIFLLVEAAIGNRRFWTVFEALCVVSFYLEVLFHAFLSLWSYLFVLVTGWGEFKPRSWCVIHSIWRRSNPIIDIIPTQILSIITTNTRQIWRRWPLLIPSANHTSPIPSPHSNSLLIHLFLQINQHIIIILNLLLIYLNLFLQIVDLTFFLLHRIFILLNLSVLSLKLPCDLIYVILLLVYVFLLLLNDLVLLTILLFNFLIFLFILF